MGSNWSLVTIDDLQATHKGAIAIGPFGSRMKSDCYVESGIPVIRGTNITGGSDLDGEFVYISEEMANSLGACNVYQNDLVFPHRGSIGEVGIITDNRRYVISSSLMKLTCDETKAYPKFIYYFFKSPIGKYELLKNSSQVGTPGIGQPLSSLKSITLRLPPLEIQGRIIQLLSGLDNKILINRQINQTLEQMAQTLFKSWFVDFDPVIDNALDAGNDMPDTLQERAEQRRLLRAKADFKPLPAETRALFPSEFEETELGWVPKGWAITRLENILELAYGKALKKTDRIAGKFPVYGSGGIDGTHNESLVKGPGIIVGRKGTVGSLHWEYDDFYPIDTVFYVKPKQGYSLDFCFQLLKTLKLENMNTDAAVPGLNRNNAYRLECIAPNNTILEFFSENVGKYQTRISFCLSEINSLAQLRDRLIPKLISGELVLDALPEVPELAEAF